MMTLWQNNKRGIAYLTNSYLIIRIVDTYIKRVISGICIHGGLLKLMFSFPPVEIKTKLNFSNI